MKLTTKKTIARELLFLLALLAITTLAWIGVIINNYSLKSQIDNTENDLVFAEKKLDSLHLAFLPNLNDEGNPVPIFNEEGELIPESNAIGILSNAYTKQEKTVSELKVKKNNLKNPLSNSDIKDLLAAIFLYGLVIIFGGRYLYITARWAIKTVKE
jgi:hypothetical protein